MIRPVGNPPNENRIREAIAKGSPFAGFLPPGLNRAVTYSSAKVFVNGVELKEVGSVSYDGSNR